MSATDVKRHWISALAGGALTKILIPAIVGVLACLTAIKLSDAMSERRLVIIGAAITAALFALKMGRFRDLCLGVWIIVLPYPRTYYLDSGVHGFHGPYLVASDAFLLLLYVFWWFDAALRKNHQSAKAGAWWPWLGPFVFACILSVFGADRPDWAVFELFRVIRLGLILLYLRYNLNHHNLAIIAIAAIVSVAGECTSGLLQITTQRFATQALVGEEFARSAGQLIHPNILAAFLLLQLPLVVALAASLKTRWQSQACWIVAVLCVAALGGTMSRAAWALTAAELAVMALVLIVLRLVRVQFVLAIIVFSLVILAGIAIPLRAKLERRVMGNLRDSIDTRQELNRIALQISRENPITGTGLSNFEDSMTRIAPEWDQDKILAEMQGEGDSRRLVRWRMLVHNFWLLILAETGWLGLIAFLWLLFGILWRSLGLLRIRNVSANAFGAAAIVGLTAVCAQQFLEFTLWTDSILFMFALIAGITAALPAQFRNDRTIAHEVLVT